MRGHVGWKEIGHQGWRPGSWVESMVVWLIWRGMLGEEWVGLGNPKFRYVLVSLRYTWFVSAQAFRPPIFITRLSSRWPCVEPSYCGRTLGLLFPHCRQAALMKLSLYKPIALFTFGLFPKVRCIWGASPKDLRSQEMNEPFLWLLLHISRLSIKRQFLQSATSNQ